MSQLLSISCRPSSLSQIIGQDAVVKALAKSLSESTPPSAFLFYGIRGVGKTTLARILACSFACLFPVNGEACGNCDSCQAFRSASHLDITELDAASRTGVDDIRDIINACQYTPVIGRNKVFVIDEVHMLSKSAFNALLKTLEEPPTHVKFIFATTEINKVPDTVLSRCLVFQLRPISIDVLSNHLLLVATQNNINLTKDASELIAEESGGSVRDALSLLKQASLLSEEVTTEVITSIIGGVRPQDIKNLLAIISEGRVSDASICIKSILAGGADALSVYKQLQKELYAEIIDKKENKNELTRLLYLWQILLKQYENINNTTYPDCIIGATVIMLAHAASFPDISTIINYAGTGNGKIDEILSLFPKSIISEVE